MRIVRISSWPAGELYDLHRDDDDDEKRNADRIELSRGGGETLFTHRSMEEESLMTEHGALKLFQSYCNRPKRKHQLVEPVVGRGQNWYSNEKNETTFARESNHGVCPVLEGPGRKCVVQQWIGRSKRDPLKEECVAGTFPFEAEFSYRELLGGHTFTDGSCVKDVSAQRGTMIPSMCLGSSSSSSSSEFRKVLIGCNRRTSTGCRGCPDQWLRCLGVGTSIVGACRHRQSCNFLLGEKGSRRKCPFFVAESSPRIIYSSPISRQERSEQASLRASCPLHW
jgi:hypothetical protein